MVINHTVFPFPCQSVQFSCSVVSYSLRPHGLQHPRLLCPSPTPGACSNSCPPSRWYHSTISSSVVPISSCLQSYSASESFPMSQFFASGGQSIGVSASASVVPMNIQDCFKKSLLCNVLIYLPFFLIPHSCSCVLLIYRYYSIYSITWVFDTEKCTHQVLVNPFNDCVCVYIYIWERFNFIFFHRLSFSPSCIHSKVPPFLMLYLCHKSKFQIMLSYVLQADILLHWSICLFWRQMSHCFNCWSFTDILLIHRKKGPLTAGSSFKTYIIFSHFSK